MKDFNHDLFINVALITGLPLPNSERCLQAEVKKSSHQRP